MVDCHWRLNLAAAQRVLAALDAKVPSGIARVVDDTQPGATVLSAFRGSRMLDLRDFQGATAPLSRERPMTTARMTSRATRAPR
jgi:hypothetical protein